MDMAWMDTLARRKVVVRFRVKSTNSHTYGAHVVQRCLLSNVDDLHELRSPLCALSYLRYIL